MNENELKELWNSEDSKSLPKIDFEQVQENISVWQNKLRRKIKFDISINAILLIALIPVCFILPKLTYFMPLIILMSLWSFRKLWHIYQQEMQINNYENTRMFLETKTSLLKKYIRQTRWVTYLTIPLLLLSTFLLQATVQWLWERFITFFLIIFILELFTVIWCEIYFRIMYFPVIKTSKELLEQLESEN